MAILGFKLTLTGPGCLACTNLATLSEYVQTLFCRTVILGTSSAKRKAVWRGSHLRRVAAALRGFCPQAYSDRDTFQPTASPPPLSPGIAARFPGPGRKPPISRRLLLPASLGQEASVATPIVPAESTLIVLSEVGPRSLARGKLWTLFQRAVLSTAVS